MNQGLKYCFFWLKARINPYFSSSTWIWSCTSNFIRSVDIETARGKILWIQNSYPKIGHWHQCRLFWMKKTRIRLILPTFCLISLNLDYFGVAMCHIRHIWRCMDRQGKNLDSKFWHKNSQHPNIFTCKLYVKQKRCICQGSSHLQSYAGLFTFSSKFYEFSQNFKFSISGNLLFFFTLSKNADFFIDFEIFD